MVRPPSDKPKEHFFGVKLTDELHEALEAEAKRQDRPKSWIVREALAAYVTQAKTNRKGAK